MLLLYNDGRHGKCSASVAMVLLLSIFKFVSPIRIHEAFGFQICGLCRKCVKHEDNLQALTAMSESKSNNDHSDFDPLVSPHKYVDGIDVTLDNKQKEQKQSAPTSSTQDAINFDPLLSPHAYPKGTEKNTNNLQDDEDWTPFKMNSVKDDFIGASEREYGVQKSQFTREWSLTINSTPKASSSFSNTGTSTNNPAPFDPLLSPHAYPNGVDAGSVDLSQKRKQQTIGIILIDHGSRRSKSNEQLQHIAQIYQSRVPSDYIVKAAHMEIASPSIKDTLLELVHDENISKVVCHPYFLSPGRHVTEDIPELIEEAIDEIKASPDPIALDQDLEVILTEPIGSKLNIMVDLISNIVDDSLGINNGSAKKDPGELGGLFAEIKQMMDEQL